MREHLFLDRNIAQDKVKFVDFTLRVISTERMELR